MAVLTPKFRLSFPKLAAPEAYTAPDGTQSKPKYSCVALWLPDEFDKSDEAAWSALRKEIDRVCRDKFGKGIDKMPRAFKTPLRDGTEERPDFDEFAGGTFATLSANPSHPPLLVGPDAREIAKEDVPREFVYGSICRAHVNAYAYDWKVNRGVSLGLNGIQLLERASSASTASFDPVEGADDGVSDDTNDDIPF